MEIVAYLHWNGDDWRVYTAGKTSHVTECFDRSVYPVEQTRPCNVDCGEWTVQLIGQWSDCQLLTDTPSSMAQLERVGTVRAGTAYCGIGRRYHAVVCANKDGRQNVSAAVCGATGAVLWNLGRPSKNPAYRILQTEYSGCLDISAHA